MFLENPSEGFIIEPLQRYYAPSPKLLLYAQWREGEGKTPPPPQLRNVSREEACRSGQLGGQLLKFQ